MVDRQDFSMRLFNRDLAMYRRNAARIPAYGFYFLRCFLLFQHPLTFIASYLRMTPPPEQKVTLRNGMVIHLSGHPHDIVTVFLIFVRRDYGMVPNSSTVIDIGANIGVYALYAAFCGARSVKAYEPNSEAYTCLQRNIRENRLEGVIAPFQFAVTGQAGNTVRFPKASSAYNQILAADTSEEYESVGTVDLSTIMNDIDRVDVLKMDCEGSEWEILQAADRNLLEAIRAIRMEYHMGHRDRITSLLEGNGFSRQYMFGTMNAGTMWFTKR
jgi:FkbM family methyltransferase